MNYVYYFYSLLATVKKPRTLLTPCPLPSPPTTTYCSSDFSKQSNNCVSIISLLSSNNQVEPDTSGNEKHTENKTFRHLKQIKVV